MQKFEEQLKLRYPVIKGKFTPMYPVREAPIVSKSSGQFTTCSVCSGKGDVYMLRQMEMGKKKSAQGGRQ